LRYLQTLLELGADQNSIVVFPLPLDIVGPFLNSLTHGSASAQAAPAVGAPPLGNGAAPVRTSS